MNAYFCKNIRYLRVLHNLSQKKMAEILGVSGSTLRKMEREDPNVRINGAILCRVCDHFDLAADRMLRTVLEEDM